MKRKYYKVILTIQIVNFITSYSENYCLGYTTNKWDFQKQSGWPMKNLAFILMGKTK